MYYASGYPLGLMVPKFRRYAEVSGFRRYGKAFIP